MQTIEEKRAYQRQWHKKNRERQLEHARRRYQELKKEAYELLGNACACCNEVEKDFLSLDHIGGWGQEHRMKLCGENRGGGVKVLRAIIKCPTGFQLLCFNCHMCISLRGFCPHRRNTNDPRFYSDKLGWKDKSAYLPEST